MVPHHTSSRTPLLCFVRVSLPNNEYKLNELSVGRTARRSVILGLGYSKFCLISFNTVYIQYYVYISTVREALGFERRRRISGTGGHAPAGRRRQGRRSRDAGSRRTRWPAIRERGVYGTSGKARVAITRSRGAAGRQRGSGRVPFDRRARLLGAAERRRGAAAPRVADQAGRDCGAVCSERHGQNDPPHPPVPPRPAALPGCICTQRTRRRMMGSSLPAHTAMTQPNHPASPAVHHEECVPAAGCRRGRPAHRKGERLTDVNCFRRQICCAACPSAATRRTRQGTPPSVALHGAFCMTRH